MNMKELETLVAEQGRTIALLLKAANADEDWSAKLGGRIDRYDEALSNVTGRIDNLQTHYADQARGIVQLQEAMANVTGRIDRQTEGSTAQINQVQALIGSMNETFAAKVEALTSRIDDVNEILRGQNDTLHGVYEELKQALGDVRRLEECIGAGDADGPFYAEFVALKDKLEDVAAKVEGRNKSAAVKRNMTDLDALEVLTGKYKELGHKEAAEQIGLTYAQVYSCRLCFTFKHVHHKLEKDAWKNPWSKG